MTPKREILFRVLTVLGFLLAVGTATAERVGLFRLRRVMVSGNTVVSREEILQRAKLPFGLNLFALDCEKIARRVAADPRFWEVTVSRQLPDAVEISVTEKKPALTLNTGQLWGLTANLEVLPEEEASLSLPVVTAGYWLPDRFYQANRQNGLGLAAEAYRALVACDSRLLETLSEISVAPSGDVVLYLLPKGVAINFGTGDFSIKVQRLSLLLAEFGGSLPDLAYDLRFAGNLFVTPKDSLSLAKARSRRGRG
jgi:cell division protein FtsQ